MPYCVNSTIVTSVIKGSKIELDLYKCQVWCNVCGRENCEKKTDWKICPDCNKEVRSQECFIAHKVQKKGRGKNQNVSLPSLCEQYWQCEECGVSIKRDEK